MKKSEKIIRRLPPKQKAALAEMVSRIESGELAGLDALKLKGHRGIYRARVGPFRIIFRRSGERNRVLVVDRRSEGTYKNL